MGFGFLSAKAAQAIVRVLAYLTNTIRSQGFSPSQRFDPARASWFYFTPHPPIGFRPTEPFPLSQPWQLSLLSTLLLLDQLQFLPEIRETPLPLFQSILNRLHQIPIVFVRPLHHSTGSWSTSTPSASTANRLGAPSERSNNTCKVLTHSVRTRPPSTVLPLGPLTHIIQIIRRGEPHQCHWRAVGQCLRGILHSVRSGQANLLLHYHLR
jgi:hypothetical protein